MPQAAGQVKILIFLVNNKKKKNQLLIDISSINFKNFICANNFCDAGQVPILRYFEVCESIEW